MSELPELGTRGEVAARLRVHPATVDRLISSGALEAVKFGATVRIPRSSVLKFLEGHITAEPVQARTRKQGRAQKPLEAA